MFRPVRSNPNGFDVSGSSDLTLPPPTTPTEAFIVAHTEVLCLGMSMGTRHPFTRG
jgi:hypothetical protein